MIGLARVLLLFEWVLAALLLRANHAVHLKKTLYVLVAYPDLLLLLLLYFHDMLHDRVYLRLLDGGGGVGMAGVPPVPPSSCTRIDLLHPLLVLGIVVVELVAERGGNGGGGWARKWLPVLLLGRWLVVMGLHLQGEELRLTAHWV